MAIHEDQAAGLWIGTWGGGLNRLHRNTGTFTRYLHEPDNTGSLSSNNIRTIYEDRAGTLWVGTWGGGLNQSTFEPTTIVVNTTQPPVVLTAFKIFNENIELEVALSEIDDIELSYRDAVFSFEFAALDYHAPQKNQYAYMLEGFNDAWISLGTKRDITFTNLDPGTYTFRVKGSNNDGVWNDTGLSVSLTVTPPLWQTWWFRVAAFLTLAALIIVAHQVRTRRIRTRNRRLEEINEQLNEHIVERRRAEDEREAFVNELEAKNAELERFTYTVSHDLKSPLVTIRGFLGLLEKDIDAGDTQRMKQDIARIYSASEKMKRLLDELLELSRIGRQVNPSEEIGLTTLAHEAADMVAGQIQARGVRIDIAPAMPVVVGDRVRLLEIYQNLIDNAIKFMGEQPEPHIEIDGQDNGAEVVCFVRDNGIGIDPRFHEKVFGLFNRLHNESEGTGIGLALIKRIVEVHGGRIWVESTGEGHGSTFYFSFPRNGTTAHHVT